MLLLLTADHVFALLLLLLFHYCYHAVYKAKDQQNILFLYTYFAQPCIINNKNPKATLQLLWKAAK